MFETLQTAPPDPILGLSEAFKRDSNPLKIDLGVGIYLDDEGKTPTLACVARAEAKLGAGASKVYLPIEGSAEYGRHVRALLFGAESPLCSDGRAVTAQTVGGSGALRIAADLARSRLKIGRVWLSDPTWSNHPVVCEAAGLELATYRYFDPATSGLDFDAMLASLEHTRRGDLVLLQVCCHNPTGVDLTASQWRTVAELAEKKGFLTLFDFAYQGFADGVAEDALAVRLFAERGLDMMICSSFSKNFGLYNERVGALTVVARDADAASKALSQIKAVIRANYSSPPAHGAALVSAVLSDPELAALWRSEVDGMRTRIAKMRALFVETLAARGVERDFDFINRQRGMFSFTGIAPEHIDLLRSEHSIYAVRSGRINVAGMRTGTMDRLCTAIARVLG